jgi:uncharacterized protein (DUF433 family)
MSGNELLDRITVRPDVMAGQPVIKGTHLTVDYVCRQIGRGASVADLVREHEGLSPEDILACLWFPQPTHPGGHPQPGLFDLGHRDDVDYTQIRHFLAMTPTERLRQHEAWRSFLRRAAPHDQFRRGPDRPPEPGPG